jgi:DNA-binding CsgD family transcriptional regulator
MAPPKRRAGNGHSARVPTSVEPSPAHSLTPREHEVVEWIVEGKRNGDIAAILRVSARTVEKHVQNILDKLGVENRTGACTWWHEQRRMAERSQADNAK